MSKLTRQMQKVSGNGRPSNGATLVAPDHDQIAKLAYQLWQRRGCPVGSPEEDWNRAQGMLQNDADNRLSRTAAANLQSA